MIKFIKLGLLLMPVCWAVGPRSSTETDIKRSTNDNHMLEPKTRGLSPARLDLLTVDGPLLKNIGIGAQTKIKVDRKGNKWYFDENNNEWLHLPLEVDPLPVGSSNINEDEGDQRLPDVPNVFQALNHLKGQSRPSREPPFIPEESHYPNSGSVNNDYENSNSMGVLPDDHKGIYGPLPSAPDGFGLPDEEENEDNIVTWEELTHAAHHYPWPSGPGFPLPVFPEKPPRERVTRRTTPYDDNSDDVPKEEVTRRPPRRTRRPPRMTTPPEYEEYDDSLGLIPPFIPPHNDYDIVNTTPDYEEKPEPTRAVRQPLISLKPIFKPGRGPLRRTRGPTDPWNIFTQTTLSSVASSSPIVSVNTIIERIPTSTLGSTETSTPPPTTTLTPTSTNDPMDNMSPIIPEMPDLISQISGSSNRPSITDSNILAVINQIVSNALNAANAGAFTTTAVPTTITSTEPPTQPSTTTPTTQAATESTTTENTSTEVSTTTTTAKTPESTPMIVKIPTTADPWQIITLGKRKTPVPIVEYPTMGPIADEVWKPVMGPYYPVKPSPVFSKPPNTNLWNKPLESDVVSTVVTRVPFTTTTTTTTTTTSPTRRHRLSPKSTTTTMSSIRKRRPKTTELVLTSAPTTTTTEVPTTLITSTKSIKRVKIKKTPKFTTTSTEIPTTITTIEEEEYEEEYEDELLETSTEAKKQDNVTVESSPKPDNVKTDDNSSNGIEEEEYEYEDEEESQATTSIEMTQTSSGTVSPTIPDINVIVDLEDTSNQNTGINVGSDAEEEEYEDEEPNEITSTTPEDEYEYEENEADNSKGEESSPVVDYPEEEMEIQTTTIQSTTTDEGWNHIVFPIRKKDHTGVDGRSRP